MYTHDMIRIYRSPEASEGGGAAAAEGGAEGAAGGEGAAAAAGGQAQPEYLSKSDFESFRSEITGHLQRLTPKQQEERREAAGESKGKERPNPKDYDFKNDPTALQRYEDDADEWRYQQRKAKEKEESTRAEREAAKQKNESGHRTRVAEYRKENPSYDQDAKNAGNIMVLDEVKHAIFGSKNSAAVQHYLFKNKDAAEELNLLMQTDGIEAVREQIGEYAASMRHQREQSTSAARAASIRPPRQNLRGGSASGERKLSIEERYARSQS